MSEYTHQKRVRRYFWRVVEVVALILFVGLLCAAFIKTLKYTLPFVIGGLLAILLFPLVRRLEHRISRMAAVIIVLFGTILLITAASSYLLFAVTREAALWSNNLPVYFRIVQDWVGQQIGLGQSVFGQLPPDVSSSIQTSFINSISTVKSIISSLTVALISSVKNMPEYLFIVVIAVMTAFFILLRRDRMYAGFLKALPPGWEPKVRTVSHDMMRAFAGTIRVQVLLMLMSAVLGIIGMWLMHIHYAVILGLVFGVTGMIPILGSALLTVPWAIGALLIGDVSMAVKILALQLVISLIRHAVEPKILADSVGLDTLSTLFGLYVGFKLIGVVGLFVGPIILIGIKSLFRIRLFVDLMPDVADPYVGDGPAATGPDAPPPAQRTANTGSGTTTSSVSKAES